MPISTPYVGFIPDYTPRPELGPSKMGIHVARPNSPAIMGSSAPRSRRWSKGVDDLGFLAEVKGHLAPHSNDPGGFPSIRKITTVSREAVAAALVARQLPQMVLHPAVDHWEGWNEPDPNLDRMDWYARFEAERVRQLAQYGLRAAVGGFSTGVPELDEFVLFVPAIEEAYSDMAAS